MMNKNLIHSTVNLPVIGETNFFSKSLRFNLEVIFFRKFCIQSTCAWIVYFIVFCLFHSFVGGPWSAFENNWHLKEQFKRPTNRTELSQRLSKYILYAGLINLFLSPVMFLFSAIFCLFSYGDVSVTIVAQYLWLLINMHFVLFGFVVGETRSRRIRHPMLVTVWNVVHATFQWIGPWITGPFESSLSSGCQIHGIIFVSIRCSYCKVWHILSSNPIRTELFTIFFVYPFCRKLSFLFGGVSTAILLLFMFVDEDVAHIEHVLQAVSIMTLAAIVARVLIPDENLIFCPEQLMTAVLAHTHYLPISWKGQAHTSYVREQFGQFFQLRVFYLLAELLSPITTPLILIFYIRPRALDYVDFFRNFTVSVVGVGDVCSFAQMDVRKHGNPDWQPTHSTVDDLTETTNTPLTCETNKYTQGEHGKTELSLVHFTLTNPEWKMPTEAEQFVNGLRKHAQQDFSRTRQTGMMNTAMGQSLFSVGSLGGEVRLQGISGRKRAFNEFQFFTFTVFVNCGIAIPTTKVCSIQHGWLTIVPRFPECKHFVHDTSSRFRQCSSYVATAFVGSNIIHTISQYTSQYSGKWNRWIVRPTTTTTTKCIDKSNIISTAQWTSNDEYVQQSDDNQFHRCPASWGTNECVARQKPVSQFVWSNWCIRTKFQWYYYGWYVPEYFVLARIVPSTESSAWRSIANESTATATTAEYLANTTSATEHRCQYRSKSINTGYPANNPIQTRFGRRENTIALSKENITHGRVGLA